MQARFDPDPLADLPRWLWLWLPLFLYCVHYPACLLLAPETYNRWFPSETGFTEQFTVVCAALAAAFGVLLAIAAQRAGQRWLALWFLVFMAGCIYFGGEEASWGQHWFHWHTPQGWARINDQHETNLHNSGGPIGALLDQLPRNLLTVGALIGGGIMPWVRRARGRRLDPSTRAYWLFPTAVCIPTGLIVGLGSLPEKLQETVLGKDHQWLDIQSGEIKELMIAFFLMLYAASVWWRWRRWHKVTG